MKPARQRVATVRSGDTTVAAPSAAAAANAIVAELRALRNEANIAGQRRYGITAIRSEQLGVSAPVMRGIAKRHRRDHALALALWEHPILEVRAVAALVDDPAAVTRGQMEAWARDFDCWPIVDACCGCLFDRTPFAIEKAHAWSRRRGEFVKRAGFVLMAGLAVHAKKLPDDVFLEFLPVLTREANDDRNFVKKAVNWALRQTGKRNATLHAAAMAEAERILELGTPPARWIARDALRELRSRVR